MRWTQKQLLVVGSILLAAALACALPLPQTEDNTFEVAQAYNDFQTCVDNWFSHSESDPYVGCAAEAGDEFLDLVSQHSYCQDSNDKYCAAVNAEIEARLAEIGPSELEIEATEAACKGLTTEECANRGTHFYEVVRNPRPSAECSYNDWPTSSEPREINFQDNVVFVSNYSREDYAGHTRVGENVFEWTNPADGVTHTITFSPDGYTETADTSDCGWDIVNIISE